MTLLAIDPSSTKTGYAVMADSMTIVDAGFLKPEKTRDPAIKRITDMTRELDRFLLNQLVNFNDIVIEMPSAHVVKSRHKGAGAGLAIYGFAAGAMYWACHSYCTLFGGETHPIDAQLWTRGVPKLKRQQNVCMTFPQYDPGKDKGGDIADAIGLAVWWFRQQKAKRIAG